MILILTITQIFGLLKLFNYSGNKTSLIYTLLISLILISVSLDLLPILNRTEYPYYFPPGGYPLFVISSVYQTLYWQINAEQTFFSLIFSISGSVLMSRKQGCPITKLYSAMNMVLEVLYFQHFISSAWDYWHSI